MNGDSGLGRWGQRAVAVNGGGDICGNFVPGNGTRTGSRQSALCSPGNRCGEGPDKSVDRLARQGRQGEAAGRVDARIHNPRPDFRATRVLLLVESDQVPGQGGADRHTDAAIFADAQGQGGADQRG